MATVTGERADFVQWLLHGSDLYLIIFLGLNQDFVFDSAFSTIYSDFSIFHDQLGHLTNLECSFVVFWYLFACWWFPFDFSILLCLNIWLCAFLFLKKSSFFSFLSLLSLYSLQVFLKFLFVWVDNCKLPEAVGLCFECHAPDFISTLSAHLDGTCFTGEVVVNFWQVRLCLETVTTLKHLKFRFFLQCVSKWATQVPVKQVCACSLVTFGHMTLNFESLVLLCFNFKICNCSKFENVCLFYFVLDCHLEQLVF